MSNVIDASGILAISTRLQRLADQLRKDGQLIYKAHGIEFEPKWFPVIYTLQQKGQLSVMEIAVEIGYTHPSTISLLKELEKEKLIRSKKDKQDERKRLLSLTEKGEELIQQMKPVWKRMQQALTSLLHTENNLMAAIHEVEQQMEQKGFFERERGL
ncbi:MAG: MarR family transcriptional regulator [Chitinophaga sp.]|uniref:MarR family winged helix-turn-helix transcriptional regulator n=1 Tax=Chitinophaga sp. TaxID=1869181 RepID=UPI0025BB4017|nr:MarR family transcriptional regulator [Chitinophaga sp.]MBV8251574.1 MarR family transcriptional regulator [Chitinophaga sp.]